MPSYLLLAEANLGLRNLAQAEEFLSLANYSVLKNPECSNTIRSQLHRNFGKLYALQGKNQQARARAPRAAPGEGRQAAVRGARQLCVGTGEAHAGWPPCAQGSHAAHHAPLGSRTLPARRLTAPPPRRRPAA